MDVSSSSSSSSSEQYELMPDGQATVWNYMIKIEYILIFEGSPLRLQGVLQIKLDLFRQSFTRDICSR